MFNIEDVREVIDRIREENGFEKVPYVIEELIYDEENDRLFIIGQDRTDKSAIIGNSFVIGKLKEALGVKQITVYSKLDLLIKRKKIEEHLKLIEGTHVEFLKPILEAELEYPPMRWPKLQNNGRALVFLSIYAKALLGFAEAFGLEPVKVGIKYAFPQIEYEPIEGDKLWIYEPNEEALIKEAKERGLDIVMSDFPFSVKFREDIALINPMRLLYVPHFRIKHLFGFIFPTRPFIDKIAFLDFILRLARDTLMEPTDGARLIWSVWRR
ncbi:hypothetical protein PAP_01270 [Palaeococcus pacificus DY20341]|uniref:Uncharacterized protein n=1 Tax=Palaeococcus pacificus DY20341 TaxID=1343739 RepID=A0A075LRH5_9EURY|nr:hypothetical protein [Palaeococcus pacificus]AIF68696.1 hypothetical protein PAP_01270 [Palaeococcus pacificus DY20341]